VNAAVLNRLRQIKVEDLLDHEPERAAYLKKTFGIQNMGDIVVQYVIARWENIEALGLSDRIVWRLKRYLSVEKIDDLQKHTPREILFIPGIGQKSLDEIEEALKKQRRAPLRK
jgi:DNA-directed RNA polymerase alpha subunit